MKKVLFWDFDGVIADSADFVFEYWRQVIEEKGHRFDFKNFQEIFAGKHSWERIAEFGVTSECAQKYSDYEQQFYGSRVQTFPEMGEILGKYSDDFEHIIMSANQMEVISETLDRNNLGQFFGKIYGRDDNALGQMGTKSMKMTKFLEENQFSLTDGILIGDTVSDIREGKNAGIDTGVVEWGRIHDRDFFESYDPEFIWEKFGDLDGYLSQISPNPSLAKEGLSGKLF